jgi:hypothetical protein
MLATMATAGLAEPAVQLQHRAQLARAALAARAGTPATAELAARVASARKAQMVSVRYRPEDPVARVERALRVDPGAKAAVAGHLAAMAETAVSVESVGLAEVVDQLAMEVQRVHRVVLVYPAAMAVRVVRAVTVVWVGSVVSLRLDRPALQA